MQIAVIGTGYVGLVSGTCFSEFGFHVTCVDNDASKIAKLEEGILPIYEPGLDELVLKNFKQKRLTFTTDTAKAVADADIVFIAVGTPPRPEDGQADMQYVHQVAKDIAQSIKGYTLVVTKSTVPIGTGDVIEKIINDNLHPSPTPPSFDVASNPEFLREGAAISDFMRPDRVVVGIESDHAKRWLEQLYGPLIRQHIPFIAVGRETAEMIKYSANSFLAMKVAFINEMADICEHVGANIEDVAYGIGLDERIGERFLRAGPGFGGSCFPKDTNALIHIADTLNIDTHIINAVVKSNDSRKASMASKITNAMTEQNVTGKTIAVLGLTFKPGTDDMRAAPSLDILPKLIADGYSIRAYDPEGQREAKKLLAEHNTNIHWAENEDDAMNGADCLVILTEWNAFKALDLAHAKTLLSSPLIVDLRNIYQRAQVQQAGFTYVSIGRETLTPQS